MGGKEDNLLGKLCQNPAAIHDMSSENARSAKRNWEICQTARCCFWKSLCPTVASGTITVDQRKKMKLRRLREIIVGAWLLYVSFKILMKVQVSRVLCIYA